MNISIEIKSDVVAQKILWFLNNLKDQGIKITLIDEDNMIEEYTDQYVDSHWKEIVMSVGNDDTYYKGDQYKLDRGIALAKKYE